LILVADFFFFFEGVPAAFLTGARLRVALPRVGRANPSSSACKRAAYAASSSSLIGASDLTLTFFLGFGVGSSSATSESSCDRLAFVDGIAAAGDGDRASPVEEAVVDSACFFSQASYRSSIS